MKAYIVPGYHLPKDIHKDETYKKYFDFVCREITRTSDSEKVAVVLSGGNIDMDEPFDKVLSKTMLPLFKEYIDKYHLNCLLKTEEKSLSSLENLMYSKELLDQLAPNSDIYIFSDAQRVKRLTVLADNVFNNPKILGIDLSHPEERKNAEVVNKKEELATNFSLWALKSKANFEKFKNVYSDKYAYLRTVPPEKRKEAEIEWWKKMLASSQEILSAKN